MKKLLCLLLTLLMLSAVTVFAEDDSIILLPGDADFNEGLALQGGVARGYERGKYLGFENIDLTGMNSASLGGKVNLVGGSNGDTIRIMIDNPVSGKQIGSIVIGESGTYFDTWLEGADGVHNVYFVGSYWEGVSENFLVENFTLRKDVYKDTALDEQVLDSAIVDFYSDTWVSVDDMGRKVADFSEAGAPKDNRDVAVFYHTWHTGKGEKNAGIISEIIARYPDAMDNPLSEGWADGAITYWDEPIFGFYGSTDYWVYRQHFELLASAGVDAIELDLTNGGWLYADAFSVLTTALRDAKRDGVNVPRIIANVGSRTAEMNNRLLSAIYHISFVKNDFSDIWYFFEGKPLIKSLANTQSLKGAYSAEDEEGLRLLSDMNDFFSFRACDNTVGAKSGWTWLESFPQSVRTEMLASDGRPEFISLGAAVNHSYVGERTAYGFSEPYVKHKSYSSAFGEDYSVNGARNAWMFRDQARQALEVDPHLVLITGWNEWTAVRQAEFWGMTNVFVDTFDSDGSRDFEPTKGELKDDFYNLMVDFIRKYKGVRPAPLAGAMTAINVDGTESGWENVTPAYYNYKGLDRNSESGYKNPETGTTWTYTTTSSNRVTFSKVARDEGNFYFLAKTVEGKDIGNAALYINADRNKATGFEGYDFVIGRNGALAVEAIAPDKTFTKVGEAKIVKNGNIITLSFPKALIGETGISDFEFKWITGDFTDVLSLYENANAAPIGRFNYLYTEIEQKALTADERAALSDTAILKAGSFKMITEGGIKNVAESDIRITPVEMSGTLYIPSEAMMEILGYGRSKVEYDYLRNQYHIYTYKMNSELTKISERNWYYTTVGTYEGRENGYAKTLTAPVTILNGGIYVPINIFSDLMGMQIKNMGNGVWAIGTAADSVINAAKGYLG